MEIKDIISENGIKVDGNGIVIKKLDEMIRLLDKNNLRMFHIENKLDEISKKLK